MESIKAPFEVEIRANGQDGYITARIVPNKNTGLPEVVISTLSLDLAMKDRALYDLWVNAMMAICKHIAEKLAEGFGPAKVEIHKITPSDLN